MGPELKVSTFKREGGKAVQQQDFSVPASAPRPPTPPPKRDPYQGFADDDTTKKTTSVPLRFLQPHSSSSSASHVHPNLKAPGGTTSAPSKARPGHTLADAVLVQQAGLGVAAMDQDGAALARGSAHRGTSQMIPPEAGVDGPAEGGANGGVSATNVHVTASEAHNTGGALASKVHKKGFEERSTEGTAGLMDTQAGSRDQIEVLLEGPRRAAAADDAGGGTGSRVANLGAGLQQPGSRQHTLGRPATAVDPVLSQHTPVPDMDSHVADCGVSLQQLAASQGVPDSAVGSHVAGGGVGLQQLVARQQVPGAAVGSRVAGGGAGLQQLAASQRMPPFAGESVFGVPASSAQGQSRREIFHRQAKLAAEMQRMGMPPLLEWGSSSIKVGKAVAPGHNSGTDSDAHLPTHKILLQQVQQRQRNTVQRSRPMSGKMQHQKEEQEQQQEDERRAQHQQAQQAQRAQQGQRLVGNGNKGALQAPVHAWRLEWEARKQRAALNGPAVQRTRKMKAQMAKERAQREDLSNLAAEYEAAYQGMGRVEGEHFTALDGFSHTLLQSMRPHTPGTPRQGTTVPNNEVEGGSRACLKPVGIDIHAWQQAHERLDAYKREQALKQKQGAAQKKPAKQDARLERLAMLLAAVQKEGGTLGIDVPRQEPAGKQLRRASDVEGSHQEQGCRVSVGEKESKADPLSHELARSQASQVQPRHGSSGRPSTHSLPASQHQQRPDSAHGGNSKTSAASQQLRASRPSSSSSLSSSSTIKQKPMQSSVIQKPLKAHSSANNTPNNAAGRGADQPQISQPPRPSSSRSTNQHQPHTPAQHHAHTQQQDMQQARMPSTQPALPQHGPATSHRSEALPWIANKKGQKNSLSVVYYPVKKRPGRGQLRPEEHSQGQKQDQQQEATRVKHSQDQKHDQQQGSSRACRSEQSRVKKQLKQGHDHHHQQPQRQQKYHHHHHQHLQGKQRRQGSHHRQHQRRMQEEQQQQERQQEQQQEHPLPTDLSALPGLCASPGHSSLSSPTAAQLSRFADASDDAAAESSGSGDEWGVSSEDADERGFPKALQGASASLECTKSLRGSSSMGHHPCSPELSTDQGLEAHSSSWEAESSTGSWGVEGPSVPISARHDHQAHTSHQGRPVSGPQAAPSLQDLLDQEGLMDPTYEPPQDEDIPQIQFSPAPPWLVQPIARTPLRYRG